MITGLKSISIPAKTCHLLLNSVTQNNIDKCAEEKPIKHFSLTLSLVFHNRPRICPTCCLPTWPILLSGSLSLKFFKVHSSRFTHYRPSQGQHKLGTSSLELQTTPNTQYVSFNLAQTYESSIQSFSPLKLLVQYMKKSHKTKRAISSNFRGVKSELF